MNRFVFDLSNSALPCYVTKLHSQHRGQFEPTAAEVTSAATLYAYLSLADFLTAWLSFWAAQGSSSYNRSSCISTTICYALQITNTCRQAQLSLVIPIKPWLWCICMHWCSNLSYKLGCLHHNAKEVCGQVHQQLNSVRDVLKGTSDGIQTPLQTHVMLRD